MTLKTEVITLRTAFGLNGNYGKNGIKGDYMEQYDTIDETMDWLREVYFDVNLFDDRLFVRVGRQQLVWGESDFFQAMDVVHGYDYRGRLFYENNEEWRKPLMLFNFQLAMDEFNGTLNWFIRPGWDRAEDMGSNYNIEGGRWIPHPYRGVDFTSFTNSYRTDHDSGDWDDTTYGIRWNGTWGSIGYSFAYLKTFNAAPIVNPRSSGTAGDGYYSVRVKSGQIVILLMTSGESKVTPKPMVEMSQLVVKVVHPTA